MKAVKRAKMDIDESNDPVPLSGAEDHSPHDSEADDHGVEPGRSVQFISTTQHAQASGPILKRRRVTRACTAHTRYLPEMKKHRSENTGYEERKK